MLSHKGAPPEVLVILLAKEKISSLRSFDNPSQTDCNSAFCLVGETPQKNWFH
jgi:hypothetical protein